MDGFRFDAVNYLYEREDLADEQNSNRTDVLNTDYNALIHTNTVDQPETYVMTRVWRELIDEYSNKSR